MGSLGVISSFLVRKESTGMRSKLAICIMWPKKMLGMAGSSTLNKGIKTMIYCASRRPHTYCKEYCMAVFMIRLPPIRKPELELIEVEKSSRDLKVTLSNCYGSSRSTVDSSGKVMPS